MQIRTLRSLFLRLIAPVGPALALHGSEAVSATVTPRRDFLSLVQLATENAGEGCVRETYGALVATWQSRAARDPVVGAAMARIAADETRHAALAWQIVPWARALLDGAARTLWSETA